MTSGELSRGTYSTYVTTLLNATVVASEEKLGIDTVILDLRELVDAFDALVITSARNDRQVRALAEEVERLVGMALDVSPIRVEGLGSAEWVALDYGDVIVHVFDESARVLRPRAPLERRTGASAAAGLLSVQQTLKITRSGEHRALAVGGQQFLGDTCDSDDDALDRTHFVGREHELADRENLLLARRERADSDVAKLM